MGSKVKAIRKATRRSSGLTVQWGPMFFVIFSWKLYSLKAIVIKINQAKFGSIFNGEKGMSDREGHGH